MTRSWARPLWFVQAGAVSVPIYVTSSDEQIQWSLADSGSVAVIVENAALAGAGR